LGELFLDSAFLSIGDGNYVFDYNTLLRV